MESNSTNDKNEDTRWVQELNIESDQIKGVKIDAVLCEEDIPRHVISAKEVYYSDDYISEQENLLGASYRVDFMDSTEVNTETEKMWMSEYGEGTGYRRKCVQWTNSDYWNGTCTLSEQDATKRSEEIVDLLKIPYMVVDEAEKRSVSFDAESTQDVYYVKLVTDKGVARVRYNNPMEFIDSKEIDACLSYDEAKERLVNEIMTQNQEIITTQTIDGYVLLDDFHVQYQRIQVGDMYEYVPCYVLSKKNNWNDKIEYQNFVMLDVRK